MTTPHKQFIEAVGIVAEDDGLPRIAGRLFGYLLLSPTPRSLDEIADTLGVSKGSVSIDARLLVGHGWLRRVSRPGDRKDYYEMAPNFFACIVAHRMSRWGALRELIAHEIMNFSDEPASVRERLRSFDEAQEFFLDGMRQLLTEWRARQHQKPSKHPAGTPARHRAHKKSPKVRLA